MLYHSAVELETALLQALATTRMTAVEYRHVVFLCHLIDGGEERQEVLLGVYILLTMGREQYVSAFL